MNQLSLFEHDEVELQIYEAMAFKDLTYKIEKYKLIKIYPEHGFTCFAKTMCGKLVQLFVSKGMKELHAVHIVCENLRDDYIERLLARIEVEYFS